MKKIDVYGVCNPLIDLLCHIPDEFLQQRDLEKNRMYLVSTERQHSILKELENRNLKIEHAAGGSGANTMFGIAQLGGHSAFTGKLGFDPRGDQYRNDLEDKGVKAALGAGEGMTGSSLILVSNDGSRTMNTHLGMCQELEPDDIVAPVQFLALDDKGSLIGTKQKFRGTPKLKYLATKFPNKTKLQLWKAQARALINSDDPKHQELVKITNLEAKLKAVESVAQLEETVAEYIKRTQDKGLGGLLQAHYAGSDTWSPNQTQRMIEIYQSVIHSDFLVDERGRNLSSFRTDAEEQKELNKLQIK